MIIDVDPELLMGSIETVEHCLGCLDPDDPTVKAALSAHRVLSVLIGRNFADIVIDDETEPMEASQDPETCGHPFHIDLPGQTMCRDCGASRNPDGSWSVWS